MKKKIIVGAGVAALAAVALPFAGASADVIDNITVNVTETCVFADITPSVASSEGNQYYVSGAPGQLLSLSPASVQGATAQATSVRVNCNHAAGYTVSTTFTNLTGPAGSTAIGYGSGNSEAAAGSGTWTAYANNTAIVAANGLTGNSTTTQTYTFSYKVGLGVDQAGGDYRGTATYSLSANN